MSLSIVELASTFDAEKRAGKVVVASSLLGAEAIAELDSQVARQMAVEFAAKNGLADARVNGSHRTYAVDSEKQEITPEKLRSGARVAQYYTEIPVIRRIV